MSTFTGVRYSTGSWRKGDRTPGWAGVSECGGFGMGLTCCVLDAVGVGITLYLGLGGRRGFLERGEGGGGLSSVSGSDCLRQTNCF